MPVKNLVIDMSIPMMFSLLIQALYNIVDSIFVARLSQEALAATSYAYPIQMVMISIGVGTAVGLNAVISKNLGAKQYEEANNIASTGVILAILCSLVFSITGILGTKYIADFLAKDTDIAELCRSYLSICMIYSLGNMVCMIYQRLMQSTGKTLLSMVILLSGAVTNIILDPILIFGVAGFSGLGIKGAAIATVIGQWISMIIGIVLQERCNKEIRVRFRNYHWNWAYIKAIYQVGFPTILTQMIQSMMITGVNYILQMFSSGAVAFFGAYYKLQMFLFMPMNGLGQAAIPIVGFNYGAGNKERIKETMKVIYSFAIILSLVGSIVFFSFPGQLLGLFSPGNEMLSIGIPAIRIIAPTFVFAAITMVSGYIASGLQDGVTNMIASVVRQFIPLLPVSYILAKACGIHSVWFAFWVSESMALFWTLYRMRRLTIIFQSGSILSAGKTDGTNEKTHI